MHIILNFSIVGACLFILWELYTARMDSGSMIFVYCKYELWYESLFILWVVYCKYELWYVCLFILWVLCTASTNSGMYVCLYYECCVLQLRIVVCMIVYIMSVVYCKYELWYVCLFILWVLCTARMDWLNLSHPDLCNTLALSSLPGCRNKISINQYFLILFTITELVYCLLI